MSKDYQRRLEDDEALARMLQSQEDSLLHGASSSNHDVRPQQEALSHTLSRSFSGRLTDADDFLVQDERHHRSATNFLNFSARGRDLDIDPMEYARQLQHEAFSDLRRGATRKQPPNETENDVEIAKWLQEAESQEVTRGGTASFSRLGDHGKSDEQLAMYLSTTGKSLRNLTPEELQEVSLEASHSDIAQVYGPNSGSGADSGIPVSSSNKVMTKSVREIKVNPQQSQMTSDLSGKLPPSAGLVGPEEHASDTTTAADKKKKRRGFLGFKKKTVEDTKAGAINVPSDIPLLPPSFIPPPPGGSLSAPPTAQLKPSVRCDACKKIGGAFISALGNKFHEDCFTCTTCGLKIGRGSEFVTSKAENGELVPHHKECFAPRVESRCVVCSQSINSLGSGIPFVCHPFFQHEKMCVKHAREKTARRCTSCSRFEPWESLFVDLEDAGRILCFSCLRTTIFDGKIVEELWGVILDFIQSKLGLEVWDSLATLPILLVTHSEIVRTKRRCQNPPKTSHKMARGMTLINEKLRPGTFRLPSYRYNHSSRSLEASDIEKRGYTTYELEEQMNGASLANVMLVQNGLPRDLTFSIMIHEALIAWIKLNPHKDKLAPTPERVEQGCALLASYILLSEGLAPASSVSEDSGPSDADLRRYFLHCIEDDETDVCGGGFRQAHAAYKAIGMEELMNYVVAYNEFPRL